MAISRKELLREQATETLGKDIHLVDPATDQMASEKIALLMRLGAKASPNTLRRFFTLPLDISHVLTPNLSNFDLNELGSVLALTIEFLPPKESENYNNYLELFRACLARGANTDASVPYAKVSGSVRSPLDFALALKSPFIILELLKHGAYPTRVIEFAIDQNVCMDEFNELCDHIQQKPFDLPDNIFKLEHQEKIERLVSLGANIPTSIEPAIKAKLNVISLFKPMLIKLDPEQLHSIILKIMRNYDSYHLSEAEKSPDTLKKFIKHCIRAGADINLLYFDPIMKARQKKLGMYDYIDNTLLHRAIRTRQPELITLLIREGADITIKDSEGRVPLHSDYSNDADSRSVYFKAIDEVTQFQTRRVRAYYAINTILILNKNYFPPFLLSYLLDYIVGEGKAEKIVASYHRVTNNRFALFREPIPSEPTPPNPLPLPTHSQPGS